MVETPWLTFRAPDSDRECVAILSYLPLARMRSLFRFQILVRRIRRQLASTQGILGYSLRARFLAKTFWTLSVWEEKRVMAFVRTPPHRDSMIRMNGSIGPTKFVRWRVRGSEVPLSREAALGWAEQAPSA